MAEPVSSANCELGESERTRDELRTLAISAQQAQGCCFKPFNFRREQGP